MKSATKKKATSKNQSRQSSQKKLAPAVAPALATGAGAAAVAISSVNVASRLRVPFTLDPLGQSGTNIATDLNSARVDAVSNLFNGIQQVHSSLSALLTTLADPLAPTQLISSLVQPDGTPATSLQVQFDPATLASSSPVVTTLTDSSNGSFSLNLPSGMRLPSSGSLALAIHGSTGNATVSVPASQLASNGLSPAIVLPSYIAPLQTSIVASLLKLVSSQPGSTAPPPPVNPPQLAAVKLGENDGCLLKYGANSSVDRFPYGVFHRLIEPRASIVSQVENSTIGNNFTFLPYYGGAFQPPPTGTVGDVSYVDRIPVEQPISVDGFRDQLMGLQADGTFTADETRPMAGTLGLGYTLWLAQRWTFQGLALGNLVYSLPLAPGEQQEVAIFERTDTAAVFESESFTEEQQLEESAIADTSTNATFNSAFNEAVNGSSAFQTDSSSSSWGGSLILISGGSGSSSSSGTSSSSLQGQRDTTQQAAQTTHSAAENQAAARRSAARTGMRVATASESEQVTTKVITNHNHTRALTMQYWEVQRLYNVTTTIEGLTMTILVPLQVVRFMPAGQPQTITDPTQLSSRQDLLNRYGVIVKHADILIQALPRKYQRGLEMLLEFASDPSAQVDAANASAEDIINFSLTGSFITGESVWVTAVTSRNTRVGPAYLQNTAPTLTQNLYTSQDELVAALTSTRQSGSNTLTGAMALPPNVSRSDIVGFEIARSFSPITYTLATPAMTNLQFLQTLLPGTDWVNQALQYAYSTGNSQRTTITLSPAQLESLLGGPIMSTFSAQVSDGTGTNEQYTPASSFGTELPQQPYPVAAAHVPPVLKYQQILEIEKMATHVVRRTLTYSRAIWASMSSEERAILLEAYTIGVPPGGVEDATQMVPLLNCVENRVLGFFGNSMMLPFIIPDTLAGQGSTDDSSTDDSSLDPSEVQEALLSYQMDGFTPPVSTIALPTRGVLGEAVLGNCPSAEKIDITRFWNWQDSPGDTAPQISPTSLPTSSPSIAAGLTAPNSLTNLPSLINNVLTAPSPDNSLLQSLGQSAASQQDFSTALTGATQLAGLLTNAQNNANSARADALKTTKDLTSQAIATVANLVGGGSGSSNPNAGSNALAAQNGQNPGASNTAGAKGTTAKKGTATTPNPGAGPGTTAGTTTTPGGTGASSSGALAGLDAGSIADLAVLAARAPKPNRKRGVGATAAFENQED